MKYIFIFLLLSVSVRAQDFYTTRLMSTAGAGVGSILLNEAAILNPASVAFYKKSSVYYQKYKAKLQDANNQRSADSNDYPYSKRGQLFILTDTKAQAPGSMSYMTYNDVNKDRKRYALSFAKPVNKDSSFGMIYRRTKDYYHAGGEKEFNQAVFGVTHIINSRFSFGTVIVDPFKSNIEETKLLFGIQYIVSDHLYLIADFGGHYEDSLSENSELRTAVQVRFLRDLYIRFGLFEDKHRGIKGDGWGLSWSGPKLSIDFAVMKARSTDDTKTYLYNGEELVESSFTISIVI